MFTVAPTASKQTLEKLSGSEYGASVAEVVCAVLFTQLTRRGTAVLVTLLLLSGSSTSPGEMVAREYLGIVCAGNNFYHRFIG